MFGQFFHAALYLQRVLGYGAAETGFAFLPISVAIGTLSLGFSARLSLRFGAPRVLAAALALIAVGLVGLTTIPPTADYATQILPPMILLGIGGGLAFPTVTTLAMSGAHPEDAGIASGVVNTSQQVGGALGLAVLATLATDRTQQLLGNGDGHASALTGGYHLAFGVAAVLAVAGLALAAAARTARPAAVPA
jgi:MFS family permease